MTRLTGSQNPIDLRSSEDWAEDNVDMGDYLAHADEPPTVSDKRIEGASSIAEVPTIATHPPDPMHLSTPEGSPHTGDDEDADKSASEEGAADDNPEAEEEVPSADVIIEEEYFEQQEEEELDYEDNAPIKECEQVVKVEECEQVVEVDKGENTTVTEVKEPTIWKQLGDPINKRASTDTNTGKAMSLMESFLGIQSPKGGHRSSEGHSLPHSRHSDQQHTILSDDSQ